MPTLKIQCPHARYVAGATDGDGGIVCGAMERDQARADRILEGAPVGVFVSIKDDLGTLLNFCCGAGPPMTDPDDMANREFGQGHYTGCPIWAADREVGQAERMFPFERPEPEPARVPEYEPERFAEQAATAWVSDDAPARW